LVLKIESLKKIAPLFKISVKIVISTFLTKMKLLESIVYGISQLILLRGREIAQGESNILPEVSAKLPRKFCNVIA